MNKRMIPIRLQVVCYGRLTAEVILHHKDVERTISAYKMAKLRKGHRAGGVLMQRADMPRYWNIPVGSFVEGVTVN